MIINIKNGGISAGIETTGAELLSLIKDGTEYIWQRDPKWWGECSPILFPIVSRLKEDSYTLGGKRYVLAKHGFARGAEFSVADKTETSVTLRLEQTEEMKTAYPFEYDFTLSFDVSEGRLDCAACVKNTSKSEKMYFNTGAHEGYGLFDGGDINDHYVLFEQPEHLIRRCVEEGDLYDGRTVDFGITDRFDLDDRYFEDDAVFFLDLKSHYCTLCSKTSDKKVRVYFDARNLGIWKKVGAPYVCIEPWDGACENAWADGELAHKDRILSLDAGCGHIVRHSVEIL